MYNLDALTSGYSNVAIGYQGLLSTTTGMSNVGIGSLAMMLNTIGWGNTAIGFAAITNRTSTTRNTAIGYYSLSSGTTGAENTAIGSYSLLNTSGSFNVAVGSEAGSDLTTGGYNVLIGRRSGRSITIGAKNVIIGSFTGTTGESPTPVYDITTSSNNIVISDGDGNIRQTFDNSGAASMKSNPTSTQASLTLERISTDVVANDTIGYLNFLSNDSSTSSKGGVGGIAVKAEAAFNTSHTPSYMSFYTHTTTANDGTNIGNVTETMRITSGGKVGIGTTPSNWKSTWKALNIGQSVGLFSQDNNTTGLSSNVIFDGTYWTNKNIGATAFYQQSEGAHYFYGDGSSIDAAGTVFSPTARLTISSGGILHANYGISFPTPSPASSGTPNASSVLDAYEEGTWTPTIDSVGYTSVTYVTAETYGNYTRIGNIVTAFFYMRFSGIYVSGGYVMINGLPYTANSHTRGGAVTYTTLSLSNVPTAYPALNQIYLYTIDVGSAGSFANPTADANTHYVIGSVTYGI